MFEMERTQLFYTFASGNHQQNPPSKRLKHTSVVEQAVQLWQHWSPFLGAIEKVDYSKPEEVNTTHLGWTNLMSNISAFRNDST